MSFPVRKSPRLKNFDYATPTAYFVTMCTYQKACLFGLPDQLSQMGRIAQAAIETIPVHFSGVQIEKSVVMPNHVHMLVQLSGSVQLSALVGSYKASVSKQIHQINPSVIVWQRSYHDHVIRTPRAWEDIWTYIDQNPLRWELDCFYPQP